MNPIKADDANGVMRGNDDDVQDLPVHFSILMGIRVATSTWMPTEEERQALINGAPVKLSIYGEHPPLMIWV